MQYAIDDFMDGKMTFKEILELVYGEEKETIEGY
jgi:hypothetical protein